jgi:hypothetical protein
MVPQVGSSWISPQLETTRQWHRRKRESHQRADRLGTRSMATRHGFARGLDRAVGALRMMLRL